MKDKAKDKVRRAWREAKDQKSLLAGLPRFAAAMEGVLPRDLGVYLKEDEVRQVVQATSNFLKAERASTMQVGEVSGGYDNGQQYEIQGATTDKERAVLGAFVQVLERLAEVEGVKGAIRGNSLNHIVSEAVSRVPELDVPLKQLSTQYPGLNRALIEAHKGDQPPAKADKGKKELVGAGAGLPQGWDDYDNGRHY